MMSEVPEPRVRRARRVTLVFAVLLVLSSTLQFHSDSDVLPLSAGAEVTLLGILLGTAWRGRQVMQWEAPTSAVLTILVGISLGDPLGVLGICVGLIVALTLYDSLVGALLRALSFSPVIPVAYELSHDPNEHWHSIAALAAVPMIPIFVALTWALRQALESQDELVRRTHFLGDLAGRLLAASDPSAVTDIMRLASDGVCEVAPGVCAIAIRRTGTGPLGSSSAVVVRVHGAAGPSVPAEIPQGVLAPLLASRPGEDDFPELPDGTRQLAALGLPQRRSWRVHQLDLPPEVVEAIGCDTVVWGIPIFALSSYLPFPDRRRTEVLEMLRMLRRHGQIAGDATIERLQLLSQAQLDDPTGLLNRSAFTRRLGELIEHQDGSVSLVFLRLTGLISVFGQHGLGEMDSATRRLSMRVIDVVGADTLIGRFGDFVLALAIPGPDGVTEAGLGETIAPILSSLAEPIEIRGEAQVVAVNVGFSVAREGDALGDVIQRAASAVLDHAARQGDPLTRPVRAS